ncbi:hypothetical protein TNCV_3991791 [Trichonephila clavipes]|uniref:Uncharacterized protein n=1 Tax=Trichonephila clavipes TaxID=2585209 RepID=A0A8X6T195_TRICX|nr:hypothetical protein TNCV_3991791 [Trichonephila clavipes]
MKTQQGEPVRARNIREKHYNPYIKEQAKSGSKNTRRRDDHNGLKYYALMLKAQYDLDLLGPPDVYKRLGQPMELLVRMYIYVIPKYDLFCELLSMELFRKLFEM